MINESLTSFHSSTVVPSCTLSIVVPVFNEEAVLAEFHQRLISTVAAIKGGFEIVYVDDGSKDATEQILKDLQAKYPMIAVARFSRNFGKEQATSAGLHLARGEAVVVIDSDLQDPPELIPMMVDAWRQGAEVVKMRRRRRKGETWLKKVTAHAFYRVINLVSEVQIPEDVGDFCLLSRRAVDAMNQLPESNRFMKGLFAWIGFRHIILDYDRHARAAGYSKWHYWKLWNFALEGITSFSVAPLKVATYVGFVSAVSAFFAAMFYLIKTIVHGDPTHGFPTLIVTILFLGGLQLMAIGILGEYLGRLFMESKRRPLYLLEDYRPASQNPQEIAAQDSVQ